MLLLQLQVCSQISRYGLVLLYILLDDCAILLTNARPVFFDASIRKTELLLRDLQAACRGLADFVGATGRQAHVDLSDLRL